MFFVDWYLVGVIGAILFAAFVIAAMLRVVVPSNEVHTVQNRNVTISYGKDTNNGNAYYAWPSWLPYFGIEVIKLPVNIFDIELENYEAYDLGRLPFVVDVKAFFRVSDPDIAAQRVSSFNGLLDQLIAVVQGAVRAILASSDIEDIMQGRGKFGEEFTKEVKEQLMHWGVEPVKNIELMDLRDSDASNVIKNIMDKKKSMIEMESRQAVALNNKKAQIAEIEATREVDLQKEDATQQVGTRRAESQREIALAEEKKNQAISETKKESVEKDMEVKRIGQTREAEISKNVVLITAQQNKEKMIIDADAKLEQSKKAAEGVEIEGKANAEAEKAKLLAPVDAQIKLLEKVKDAPEYTKYLLGLEKIKASISIGVAQAEALKESDLKIIATGKNAEDGVKNIGELLSAHGGSQIAAMLEGFAQTDMGKKILGDDVKE